jgi:integrase
MHPNGSARRKYGTGSISERDGKYLGKWRVNGEQIMRTLGSVRQPGSSEGLTGVQAEAELRRRMAEEHAPLPTERVTVEQAGRQLVARLESLGRKKGTTEAYESILRVHLAPYFGAKPLAKVQAKDVEAYVASRLEAGLAPKSTQNHLGFLHGIFELGLRQGWVTSNPCKLVDKPRAVGSDADIRFLTDDELEALLRATADDDLGRVERVMYLAAAMTGMRQGELLALRWLDVDWLSRRVRVRRSFVRGEFGTPKSKRSSRSVPLADRLGAELDRLHGQTPYSADEDLVFAHPHTGRPIDRSRLLKRFKAALMRAGVREVRFHDLRHTFGTRMAAAGVPMRTLQEWFGHRDFATTLIYADYQPGAGEVDLVNAAFAPSTNPSTKLRTTQTASDPLEPAELGVIN